jgi:hypothetical protein
MNSTSAPIAVQITDLRRTVIAQKVNVDTEKRELTLNLTPERLERIRRYYRITGKEMPEELAMPL